MSEWTIHDEAYWTREQKAEFERKQVYERTPEAKEVMRRMRSIENKLYHCTWCDARWLGTNLCPACGSRKK